MLKTLLLDILVQVESNKATKAAFITLLMAALAVFSWLIGFSMY